MVSMVSSSVGSLIPSTLSRSDQGLLSRNDPGSNHESKVVSLERGMSGGVVEGVGHPAGRKAGGLLWRLRVFVRGFQA